MKKRIILYLIFITFAYSACAQFSLEELLSIKFGSEYSLTKDFIVKKLRGNITISKGSHLNTIKIESPDITNSDRSNIIYPTFDIYGECRYEFVFVNNKLIYMNIQFPFESTYKDKIKFEETLKLMFKNFTSDERFSSLGLHPDDLRLNTDSAINKVWNSCSINESHSEGFDQAETFGIRMYDFYLNLDLDQHQKIRVEVSKENIREWNILRNSRDYIYDGCVAKINMIIWDKYSEDKMFDVIELESNVYHSIIENTKNIILKSEDGVYKLPVTINNSLTIDFVLDLGASDVSISADVFSVLYKTGAIGDEDFIGTQSYKLADGTILKSKVFNLKSIKIGNKDIQNVRASISNSNESPLLLGQSALKQLGSYRIDNVKKLLILD